MEHASISSVRPERPLTVKCALERSTRRIQFTSSRNCSISLLKTKVEECFSLPRGSFIIAYKDDDGETMDIVTDADLTEAILYFQSGVDDVPISSAASFYSSKSVGSRKITLRVHVIVEYDGPSLSDSSSMASLEDDRDGEADDPDFRDAISLTGSYDPNQELEDDSVTISSRDTGQVVTNSRLRNQRPLPPTTSNFTPPLRPSISNNHLKLGQSSKTIVASKHAKLDVPSRRAQSPLANEVSTYEESDSPASSEFSAAARYPADPSAVFERLRYLEQGTSSAGFDAPPQAQIERGKLWLLEQSSRTTLAPLIGPESDAASSAPDLSVQDEHEDEGIEDNLALQQDRRGRYYYTYTGGSSSASQSQFHDNSSDWQERSQTEEDAMEREALLPLNRSASSSRPVTRTFSDPLPSAYIDVPADLLPFIDTPTPPSYMITDCSSCGQELDSIRYICSTCGEKRPCLDPPDVEGKGKGRQSHSHTRFGNDNSNSPGSPFKDKPLPGIPHPLSISLPPSLRRSSDSDSLDSSRGEGYELCSNCIQFMGISHAVEGTVAPSENSHIYPPSPDNNNAISLMRRSAPKRKGLMRHAFLEKMWAGNFWKEVEQDMLLRCSVCSSALSSVIYKCSTCERFELCRACYSQVHEIHPRHAFIVFGDGPRSVVASPPSPKRSFFSDSDAGLPQEVDLMSMVHPGVKCAHCMLDIVGARFHCAICDAVDICSNCESAGLPGNLTSDDGGHDSSHIMIKIPYPQETAQVQMVSKKAVNLWKDRDAPNLTNGSHHGGPQRRRSGSVDSDRARTVIGGGHGSESESLAPKRSHDLNCRACGKNIVGIRYQCATCPSLPTAYNLCSDCEPLSYVHHDPMHFFLKVVRPVDRPIESAFGLLPAIYKTPAGTRPDGTRNLDDPQDYIRSLYHHTSLCDVCMERIRGEWYRCAYCAKDLCRDHEAMDTHNPSHLFIVFKSSVDMSQYRIFTDLENPAQSPPLIPYAVYKS